MIVGIQDIKEPFNGFSHESRSTHRTPNFTNPEFQFPQFKVLQSVFFLFNITSYIGIFGCIWILI